MKKSKKSLLLSVILFIFGSIIFGIKIWYNKIWNINYVFLDYVVIFSIIGYVFSIVAFIYHKQGNN